MSKRQLSSKYKELVDYVNELKRNWFNLSRILKNATEEANKPDDKDNELWEILEELYVTVLSDEEATNMSETIIDIYNGNYELEEPKYYWKLKLYGIYGNGLYAFKFGFPSHTIGITLKDDDNIIDKFTKDKLIEMLANTDTNLTIDNFAPVEELN